MGGGKRKMKHGVKRAGLWVVALMGLLALPLSLWACDVAVISGLVSLDGRPFIWKNRDEPFNWIQGVQYYKAKHPEIGGNIRVMQRNPLTGSVIPSGGVNDVGFAVTNTTVYDPNLINEFFNKNVVLTKHALEKCETVEDFEALLNSWDSSSISGNFAVIDAHGGAALFEAYTEQGVGGPITYEKFDANQATDEDGSFIGFVNRTNSHQWIEHKNDDERERRAHEIMTMMVNKGRLSHRNVMQEVAKDVCCDAEKENLESFDTRLCISRARTRLALVVHGVAPEEDPRLCTFWITLGEPSAGVSVPLFSYPGHIPRYAQAYYSGVSRLNLAIVYRELHLYDNNGFGPIPLDRTINYSKLLEVQEYSIPIEDIIFDKTEEYLAHMRVDPEQTTKNNLDSFSEYCARFALKNYIRESVNYYGWNFENPW